MGNGILFQIFSTYNTVSSESVVDIKPGDSSVLVGYQLDEFTHTWLAECFVAQLYIYPGFTGKLSTHTDFPAESGYEDYLCLDQAVANFECGLDSILTDSVKPDVSFDEHDAMPSSASSRFLHLVSTISDNSKLLLAASIKSHKLWCQARVLLPVPQAGKCQPWN